jgi:hypothetical protein
MTVYPVVDSHSTFSPHKTQPNDAQTWQLDALARYERRLELGRHLSDDARQWLHKPSQLARLTLWLELLHKADIDGVCDVARLHSWQLFDTARKRDYVLNCLESYGLVNRLEQTRVQVVS